MSIIVLLHLILLFIVIVLIFQANKLLHIFFLLLFLKVFLLFRTVRADRCCTLSLSVVRLMFKLDIQVLLNRQLHFSLFSFF